MTLCCLKNGNHFVAPHRWKTFQKIVDGFIHPLGGAQMAKILDQIIAEKSRLFEIEKGFPIEVDQSARQVLLDRGYSPDLGARPLERAIDECVVQPLVDAWFANRLKRGLVRFTAAAAASGAPKIVFSQDV